MKLPIVIEDSKIPVWISKISGFNISAMSFFIFIICRNKITDRLRLHETIHYEQQKELLFLGQWILYAYYVVKGLIKHKDRKLAYRSVPFEQEAYTYHKTPNYLLTREKYAWRKFRG